MNDAKVDAGWVWLAVSVLVGMALSWLVGAHGGGFFWRAGGCVCGACPVDGGVGSLPGQCGEFEVLPTPKGGGFLSLARG